MASMIAYCGLNCGECSAFIATQANSDKQRKAVADDWTKKFGHQFKPQDINCDGCLTVTGRHIGHWSVCEIRACGLGRGLANCAYCPDYACDKLERYLQMTPVMKANLDGIRKGLK